MRKKERKQVGEQLASTQDIEKEFEEFGVKKRVNRHPPVQIRYEGNIGVYSTQSDHSKVDSTESLSVSRLSKLKDKLHRSKKEDGVVVKSPIHNTKLYREIHSIFGFGSTTLLPLLMRCEKLPESRVDKVLNQIESLIFAGANVLEPSQNGVSSLSFVCNNLMSTNFYYVLYNAFMQVNEVNAAAFIERSMLSDGKIKDSLEHEDVLRARISYIIEEKINDFLDDGDTFLHRACRMGDRNAIVAFIALGANHRAFNRSGIAPMVLTLERVELYDFYMNTLAQLSQFLPVEQPKTIELGVELLRTPEIIRKVSSQPYHHNPEHLSYSSDSQEYDIERAPSFIKDSLRKSHGIPKSQSYGSDLSKSPKGNGGHSK